MKAEFLNREGNSAKFSVEFTAEEFEAAASQASADDSSVTSSSFTFGDDDTYPDAAIIEATKGLEDNALVGYPVQAGESFYVLFVADAFDEEATQEKKEEIVDQRKSDAINDVYEEWAGSADESFEFDSAAWSSLIYDIALNYETEPATEALTEGAGEEMSESVAVWPARFQPMYCPLEAPPK